MIDLDKLQEMWEKDSKIDMDNLHTESTNIPTLHAKYFELYNTIFLMRKKAEQQRKVKRSPTVVLHNKASLFPVSKKPQRKNF